MLWGPWGPCGIHVVLNSFFVRAGVQLWRDPRNKEMTVISVPNKSCPIKEVRPCFCLVSSSEQTISLTQDTMNMLPQSCIARRPSLLHL